MSFGQDANWDFKNYHFYNGYAALEGRFGWDLQPAQLQTYYNPLLDAAVYLLATHAPPRCVGFVLGAVQGVNLWLLYLLACASLAGFERRSLRVVGLSCSLLGAFGAVGIGELGTTFHDLTTCPFVLGAVLVVTRALGEKRADAAGMRAWFVAGGLLGTVAGVKYTLAVYAVAAFAATVAASGPWKVRVLRSAALGTGVALGMACTAGYWMLRLWRSVGNPLFPYYNQLFKSPHTEPMSYVDDGAVPKSFGEGVAFPFRLALSDGGIAEPSRDPRFAAVFVLGIGAVVAWAIGRARKRPLTMAARPSVGTWILVFFCISYSVWLKQWAIYRYAALLEQLAPLVILLLASTIVRQRKLLTHGVVVAFAALGTTVRAPDYGRVPWTDDFLGVRVPATGKPGPTTVVITTDHPLSYVVPAFPKETRFVRVESNFFSPGRKTKLAEIVAEALQVPNRDYRLLTAYVGIDPSRALLAAYDFAIVSGSCTPLQSKFDRDLVLCELRRADANTIEDPGVPIHFGAVAAAAGITGKLVADPDPVPVCDKTGLGVTTVSWTATGTEEVEVRVDSPSGALWARGPSTGSGVTGNWVREMTTFYLQNVAHGAALGPAQTLARLVVKTTPGGRCP